MAGKEGNLFQHSKVQDLVDCFEQGSYFFQNNVRRSAALGHCFQSSVVFNVQLYSTKKLCTDLKHVKTDLQDNIHNFTLESIAYLDLWI